MTYAERKTAFIANRNNMTAAECDAERNALNALFHVEQNAKVDADFLAGVEVDTTTFLDMLKRYGQAPMQGWFQHAVQGVSAEGYSTYKLTSAQTRALTVATALLVSAMREPTDATTAQQVPAQSVYILELATMGRNDVASKEYMDFKRASQAFEDAVRMVEQAGKWSHVTRIELFNDVSGSLMRWRRTVSVKAPALASPVEPVPPAGGEPDGYKYRIKTRNNRAWTYAKDKPENFTEEFDVVPLYSGDIVTRLQTEVERWKLVAQDFSERRDELKRELDMRDGERHSLQSELTKALELLEHMLKDDDMPVHWFAQRIDDFRASQSAPADKDVQP